MSKIVNQSTRGHVIITKSRVLGMEFPSDRNNNKAKISMDTASSARQRISKRIFKKVENFKATKISTDTE